MSGDVWVSLVPGKTEISKPVGTPWDTEGYSRQISQLVERNDHGEVLDRSEFPPELYGQGRHYRFNDMQTARRLPLISSAMAGTLREFDLGNANLYQVPIFQRDQQTPVEGDWFFINFGNVKHSFVPERSAGVEQIDGTDYWMMPIKVQDGDVAVSAEALEGPDIWVDPRCQLTFFLSDRLAREIKARKLARYCFLRKCKVV